MVEVEVKQRTNEKLNWKTDLALITIKPEPLEDGRAEKIIERIEKYCSENGLKIIGRQHVAMQRRHIIEHYGGKGKLEEVGKKVIGSIRMSDELTKRKAEEAGLTKIPLAELGSMVRDIELDNYVGRDSLVLVIAGKGALSKIRFLRGASDPGVSAPGTLRKDFSKGMRIVDILVNKKPLDNVVHVPLNWEELQMESKLLFGLTPEEIIELNGIAKNKGIGLEIQEETGIASLKRA